MQCQELPQQILRSGYQFIIYNLMKIVNKSSAVYSSPAVIVLSVDTEGLLCTSSELDNLQKDSFDFSWEN